MNRSFQDLDREELEDFGASCLVISLVLCLLGVLIGVIIWSIIKIIWMH